MQHVDALVAVFEDHRSAETAVKRLISAGLDTKQLSVAGRGFRTGEDRLGFYNVGDRIKFWGVRGEFWGCLWGLFSGGLFITIPVVGDMIVVGYLIGDMIAGVEGALVVSGRNALDEALHGIRVPAADAIQYKRDIKADGILVTVHGEADQMLRARAIQAPLNPSRLDLYGSG
jgi:hypothetical protein